MDLSNEMKEAIRILRDDGQIASNRVLSESHKELIQRLDQVEDKWSEFRASQTSSNTDQSKQEKEGTDSSATDPVPTNPGGPEPPPVKQEEPIVEKKARLAWWERGGYAGDNQGT